MPTAPTPLTAENFSPAHLAGRSKKRPLPTSSSPSTSSAGAIIARLLAGAWREEATVDETVVTLEELRRIAPWLLISGAAGLAWRAVSRVKSLSESEPATELRQAFRLHALQAKLHEADIKRAIVGLNATGIEPLLIKGWLAAQMYKVPGARPFGDIDLVVRREEFATARQTLNQLGFDDYRVDLHEGFGKFKFSSADDEGIYERSQIAMLDNVRLRVPSPEDHLRIISLHLLRGGAWRPLWLCDVAVALEHADLNKSFDWNVCFNVEAKQRHWIEVTFALAHQLLGARVNEPRARQAAEMNLPAWLKRHVLRYWSHPYPKLPLRHDFARIRREYAARPSAMIKRLHKRLRVNSIEATILVGGRYNRTPRVFYQFGSSALRVARATFT